ncbi:MAG: hypothetical protein ACOYYS_20395 [Chloroflexota bacterium]
MIRPAHCFLLLALALFLAGCRASTPAATLTPYASATDYPAAPMSTRTAIILPSLLPTLTPPPSHTPTHTITLPPVWTASATHPPVAATQTPESGTPGATPTLGAVELYEQASRLCETAAMTTTTLTATPPGSHLPTFILLNRPYESIYWEPVTGLEWIDAERTDEVKSITCVRASRRQDATYGDETIGYTLRWDVRLVSWPEGSLLGSESFWGEGPPQQNASGSMVYGKTPADRLLTWLACDLQPENSGILCQGRGPLAFSAGGRLLAAGQDTWDVAEKRKTATYAELQGQLGAVAFSPRGDTVAGVETGQRDVHLWQASNGLPLHRLHGHTGEVTALAFSPDGQWLLSVSQDGSVRIWDAQNGAFEQTLAENLGWLHAVAISPNGKLAAAGSWAQPGLVHVWDLQAALHTEGTDEPLHTIEASKIYVNDVSFSPDSLLLATAGLDGAVRLWDAAAALDPTAGMRLVGLLQGHTGSVNGLSFSPDGKYLASGGDDRSVIVWQVANGQRWRTFPGALTPVISVAYSADGQWLAASNGDLVKIWPSP